MSSNLPVKTEDEQHLELAVILHYSLAGMFAMSGLSLVLMVGLIKRLFVFVTDLGDEAGNLPPEVNELLDQNMPIVVGSFVALCWVHAGVVVWFARQLAKRKHRVLCLIFEVFHLIAVPFGTALGILTIIILRRTSVRAMFDRSNVIEPTPCPTTSPT